MAITIPDSHQDLLTLPLHVMFVTQMKDGFPQASIVWRLWEAPHILISCPKHSQKVRNAQRDPHVTLLMAEPHNAYRYLEIRGLVERVEDDADFAFIEKITQKYLNKPYYGGAEPVENRGKTEHVILYIAPQKVNVIGYEQLV